MNVKISNEMSDNHPLNCAEIVCEMNKKKEASSIFVITASIENFEQNISLFSPF